MLGYFKLAPGQNAGVFNVQRAKIVIADVSRLKVVERQDLAATVNGPKVFVDVDLHLTLFLNTEKS